MPEDVGVPAITSQLDKASIIRLTISFLRLKDFSAHGEPPWNRDTAPKTAKGHRLRNNHNVTMELFDMHQGTHILQSLDGFAFALGTDGRFLYISETVSIYLGLSQVEMTGSSIFDYIHAADQAELAEQLGLTLTSTGTSSGGGGASSTSSQLPASPASGTGSVGGASEEGSGSTLNPDVSAVMSFGSNSGYKGLDRCFCIRMKSTLTKRGCHFKSSGYRVVMVLCRLRPQSQFANNSKSSPQLLGLVALAIALPPPTIHELRLEPDMFVTRLSFDFRIAHCEPRVADLMDYTAEDIIGRSLYGLCHAEDVQGLRKCHVDLLHKGQVMTPYYRLMNRRGGYSWIQSCATVVCSSKNGDEQSIICVNYVVSRPEYTNLVFDNCQLENSLPMPIKPEETETPSVEDSRPELSTIEDVRSELHSPGADLNQDPPPALEPIEKPSEGSSPHSNSPSTPCPQPVAVKKSRSLKRKLEPELQLKTPSNSSTAMSTSMNVELESYDRHEHSTTENPREDERWNNRPTESQQAALNTDFSTDALLAKRSTIQWIGNAPPATSSSAISILRQIYASRESVIRANVHANRVANGSFFGNENMAGGTGGASVEYPHHDVFQGSPQSLF
nr:EOG090X0484 [Triops cancriformis]